MSHDQDGALLRTAAHVHEHSASVRSAATALAIRPLDPEVAARMREVLQADHTAARAGLAELRLVADFAEDAAREGA